MANSFLKNFSGFSKLNYEEKLKKLQNFSHLSFEDISSLQKKQDITINLAENLIENAIGYFDMPLGVAVNFIIDNKPYVIPFAIEETSIIAASSKTARLVCENGEITTNILGHTYIGQIHFSKVKNFENLKKIIADNFKDLKKSVHENVMSSMVKRGGGLKDYQLRSIKKNEKESLVILHLHIDTCDSMGANLINQTCEYLKIPLEKLTGEKIAMCILSNLSDTRLVESHVVLKNQDLKFIQKIEEASLFAEQDPYRAATSNKGVLNGIDAVLIATGNDWRAVEAGLHAYASESGQYTSLTRWRVKNNTLYGHFKGPLMLGIKGGMTEIHPTARFCLKLLKFPSGKQLARICAAVGLIQNLGALKALVTDGIIQGHMKLHIKNLALQAGATLQEQSLLKNKFISILKNTQKISFTQVLKTLQDWRKKENK